MFFDYHTLLIKKHSEGFMIFTFKILTFCSRHLKDQTINIGGTIRRVRGSEGRDSVVKMSPHLKML